MKKFRILVTGISILGLLCIRTSELHKLLQYVSSDFTISKESINSTDNSDSNQVAFISGNTILKNKKNKTPYISLYADSAILINNNTGDILYKKNEKAKRYPASTTKLITALVALDYCKLTDKVIVGREVYFPEEGSSLAYLREGQVLTMQMLLEGLLIPSGNDAAYVIAVYTARVASNDSDMNEENAINYFVELMNQKIADMNLQDTFFKNPDGFDEKGQYTTAYDMAVISRNALDNKVLREITSKNMVRNIFLSGEDVTWETSNELIKPDSIYFYKYAIGLKTGTSEKAGSCLISAAKEGDIEVICVILNSTANGRWSDSLKMLEYGMEELLQP